MDEAGWPALPYADWAPTKKTLQMCAQMLGKAKLALAPPQPEWLHACLYLEPRGFTTGPMPAGERLVTMGIDVRDGVLWVEVSNGGRLDVPLGHGKCVADIWADFQVGLVGLGLKLDMWDKPQELADATPFSENTHDCTFVAEDAAHFHRALAAVQGVFDEFRSSFFGRTSVQFWWGAFDLAVLLFSGKHEPAPDDKGYIMRYDLDAEHMNAGFWPGDDNNPNPGFYAYLVPRPDGCDTAPIGSEHAGWVEAMGEWVMPYEAVRTSNDPRQTILAFLDGVYAVAVSLGGWDAEAFTYKKPPPAPRK